MPRTSAMHRALLAVAGLLLAPLAWCADVADNAEQLRNLLLEGQTAAQVVTAKRDRGCGPAGCSIDIDSLSIQRDRGGLLDGNGRRLALRQQGANGGRGLPDIDWDPIDGFAVWRGAPANRQRWGTCLEFAHKGIGKSGPYQRWTSVVLVPWASATQPGRVAHRFVGYWTGCDALTVGAHDGEVVLSTVQPRQPGAAALQLVHHRCTLQGCTQTVDPRQVSAAADSGRLTFTAPAAQTPGR